MQRGRMERGGFYVVADVATDEPLGEESAAAVLAEELAEESYRELERVMRRTMHSREERRAMRAHPAGSAADGRRF